MSPLQRLGRGAGLPVGAISLLLRQRGVKRYAFLPLLVNTLVYGLALGAAVWAWFHYDFVHFNWHFWGGVGAWLASALNRVVDLVGAALFIALLLLVSYFTFTTVGMVVASPFNDLLSERVEEHLRGAAAPGLPLLASLRNTAYSVGCSLLIALLQLGCVLLVLPLLLVPGAGVVCFFLVNAYFAGLGFLDVAMARKGMCLAQRRAMAGRLRWEVLGLGSCMQVLFMLPLLGLLLMPVGVTAATMLFVESQADTGSPPPSLLDDRPRA